METNDKAMDITGPCETDMYMKIVAFGRVLDCRS